MSKPTYTELGVAVNRLRSVVDAMHNQYQNDCDPGRADKMAKLYEEGREIGRIMYRLPANFGERLEKRRESI